jgi:response regulator RpfG family c-di-GMP phosphodiesterase
MGSSDKIQGIIANLEKAQNEDKIRKAEEAMPKESRKRKIIIVDDVQFQLVSLKERMRNLYDIYPAESSEALFKLLDNIKPEMILLDVNLRDESGYDVMEQLNESPRYSTIPVIFLSGNNDLKSIKKSDETRCC